MHINRTRSGKNNQHVQVLLRESYREGDNVKKRTIANLSDWSADRIALLEAALHGGEQGAAMVHRSQVGVAGGKAYGALFVLTSLAKRLGIIEALGDSRAAKLALLMAVLRPIKAQSKLGTVALAQNQAIKEVLGIEQFDEDDLYGALDFLQENQESIEDRLFKVRKVQARTVFLYDVTSSYLEGRQNELAAYGYNRDKKKGKKQIVIGLLMDEYGQPISVEVFKGNTGDVSTVQAQLKKLKDRFGVERVVFVGDRGMLKKAQIEEINELSWNYITALTKPQVEKLLEEDVIQLGLFQEELCEVECENRRLILRCNPVRKEEVRRGRQERIEKVLTEGKKLTEKLKTSARANAQKSYDRMVIMAARYAVSLLIKIQLVEGKLVIEVDQGAVDSAEVLDGCYALVSDVPKELYVAEVIHERYKDLKFVEDAFKTLKTGLLDVRPLWHRRADRTKGHVFMCMLSLILTLEMKRALIETGITLKEAIEALNNVQLTEVTFGGKDGVILLPGTLRVDQSKILKAIKVTWSPRPKKLA